MLERSPLYWLILTSERFLFCEKFQKWFFFERWKKINKMLKTMFKSIFKFRICSYFMYLKVLTGNNMRLYFWKFLQIKNRTLVRMGHINWISVKNQNAKRWSQASASLTQGHFKRFIKGSLFSLISKFNASKWFHMNYSLRNSLSHFLTVSLSFAWKLGVNGPLKLHWPVSSVDLVEE